MELEYLKDFIVMAKYEDLFEASEELFITPSSLSRHLRGIEDELNVELFERVSRKMKLNRYGEIFLDYACQMVQLGDACRKHLSNEQERMGNVLHVASLGMTKEDAISEVLRKFMKQYPEYQVRVHEEDTFKNWDRLYKMESNFAFVMEHEKTHVGVERVYFGNDTLAAILHREHPLADSRVLTAHHLREEPLLLFDKGSYMYQISTSIFDKEGIKPRVAATAFRGENLLNLVAKKMGIALLMHEFAEKHVVEYEKEELVILPIEPELRIDVNLVYRFGGGKKQRAIERAFLECIQETVGE